MNLRYLLHKSAATTPNVKRLSTLISLLLVSSCSSTLTNPTRVLIDQGAPGGRADSLTRQVLTREVHTVNLGFKANTVCAISNASVVNQAYANDPDDAEASWSGEGTGDDVQLFADNHIFEGMVAQISATNSAGTLDLPMKEVRLDSLSAVANTCGWSSTDPVYKAFGFEDSTDASYNDVQIIFAVDTP